MYIYIHTRWYQSKGEYAGFSGHHYFRTSVPAVEVGVIDGSGTPRPGEYFGSSDKSGTSVGYLKFEVAQLGERREIFVAAGSSFVSLDKAERNLLSELARAPTSLTSSTSTVAVAAVAAVAAAVEIIVELTAKQIASITSVRSLTSL